MSRRLVVAGIPVRPAAEHVVADEVDLGPVVGAAIDANGERPVLLVVGAVALAVIAVAWTALLRSPTRPEG